MEIVFSYPGVGLTLYNAVTSNDYPLLQGIFLVISLSVLLALLLADLVYVLADPRTRTGRPTRCRRSSHRCRPNRTRSPGSGAGGSRGPAPARPPAARRRRSGW